MLLSLLISPQITILWLILSSGEAFHVYELWGFEPNSLAFSLRVGCQTRVCVMCETVKDWCMRQSPVKLVRALPTVLYSLDFSTDCFVLFVLPYRLFCPLWISLLIALYLPFGWSRPGLPTPCGWKASDKLHISVRASNLRRVHVARHVCNRTEWPLRSFYPSTCTAGGTREPLDEFSRNFILENCEAVSICIFYRTCLMIIVHEHLHNLHVYLAICWSERKASWTDFTVLR